MKKTILIIFLIFIAGCSKQQLPECASIEVQDLLRSGYHKKYGSNNELVEIKFDMTTTTSTDKETGSKSCISNATVSFKKPVVDYLIEKGIPYLGLCNMYGECKEIFWSKEIGSRTTEVQYSIFKNEQDKSYFIKFNDWINKTNVGFEIIKEGYQKRIEYEKQREEYQKRVDEMKNEDAKNKKD